MSHPEHQTDTPATPARAQRPEGAPQQASPHSVENRFARLFWSVTYTLLFRPSPRFCHRWRNALLRLFGAKLHPTARVYSTARVWAPWQLTMGRFACIGDNVDVYNVAGVTIGECSTVSQYSFLCGATHDFEDPVHPVVARPINIGRYCWVAADVFVGPGVTIAEGTVVGARSTVIGDLPPWVVAVGSPAQAIRPRVIHGQEGAGDAPETDKIRPFPPAP